MVEKPWNIEGSLNQNYRKLGIALHYIGTWTFRANGDHTSRIRAQSPSAGTHVLCRTIRNFCAPWSMSNRSCAAVVAPLLRLPIHCCACFESMFVNRTCYNSKLENRDDAARGIDEPISNRASISKRRKQQMRQHSKCVRPCVKPVWGYPRHATIRCAMDIRKGWLKILSEYSQVLTQWLIIFLYLFIF